MRYRILILPLLLLLLSCEEVIDLPIDKNANNIVVEGWVSNDLIRHQVRLTRANGFSSEELNPIISDASIVLVENGADNNPYLYIGNGYYQLQDSLAGRPGFSYHLQIITSDGDTIISIPEKLTDVHTIDSLTFESYFVRSVENPRVQEEVFYPITFAQDPEEETNFYRWRIFQNDSLFNSPDDIYLLEDRFINGNYYANEFTEYIFEMGDTVKLEVQSLSPRAYDYFTLFKSQSTALQAGSGSTPSAIHSNLINISNPSSQILGYFGATAVKSIEREIF